MVFCGDFRQFPHILGMIECCNTRPTMLLGQVCKRYVQSRIREHLPLFIKGSTLAAGFFDKMYVTYEH